MGVAGRDYVLDTMLRAIHRQLLGTHGVAAPPPPPERTRPAATALQLSAAYAMKLGLLK